MKYNISISVDEKFDEMIQQMKEEAETKGQSFSFAILDKLAKTRENKPTKLTLDADFEEAQKFAQEMEIEELKRISHKVNVIMLTLEAFIKWESYEGHRSKKRFPNARDAERYLRN